MNKKMNIFHLSYRTIAIKSVLFLTLFLFSSCSAKKYTPEHDKNTRIAVAPYIHPTNIAELFSGILFPYATIPSQKDLIHLDTILRKTLQTKTPFTILSIQERPSIQNKDNVLKQWLEIGAKANVDYIIVPYVLEWKAARQLQNKYIPNYIIMDYYLLSIKTKSLLARSRYFENQAISLDELRYRRVPNGIFYRTNVTRFALAEDSILMMIEDFNLTKTKLLETIQ
ncbi:MAG: hypothetical protein ACRCV3_05130 [Desulfovibrionaceae bacterium]